MSELTLPQQIARLDSSRLRSYRENLDFYNGYRGREASVAANAGLPLTTPKPLWKRLRPT